MTTLPPLHRQGALHLNAWLTFTADQFHNVSPHLTPCNSGRDDQHFDSTTINPLAVETPDSFQIFSPRLLPPLEGIAFQKEPEDMLLEDVQVSSTNSPRLSPKLPPLEDVQVS